MRAILCVLLYDFEVITLMTKNKKKPNWLLRALILSLFLHLLMLSAGALLITWDFPPFAVSKELPPQPEPQQPLVFELTETPESARIEQPQQPSRFVSDKNARAQNPDAPEDLQIADPFAAGDVTTLQPPEQPLTNAAPEASPPQPRARTAPTVAVPPPRNAFSREFLAPPSQRQHRTDPGDGEIERPESQKRDTRAPDLGSFSLNTYAWEYAPYLLRLKRKIEKNIFPPPAFTYMGMISGVTYLKFRITPDGTLEGLELIDYKGHKSLMETSWRAVEVSTPFEPLPKEFPEKYLEITARFEYLIKR